MNPIRIVNTMRLIAGLVFLSLSFFAYGKQLTPNEALIRAIDVCPDLKTRAFITSTEPDLTVVSPHNDSFNSLFVFNIENGFMIVSADDSSVPLLGYSNTNNFDVDNIPPQLQWWLKGYAAQIQENYDRNISYSKITTRDFQNKIDPLITTKWDQDSPYWNKCPVIRNKNTYTGCGATAVAQVMNYHKWPVKPIGDKISYRDYNQLIEWDPSEVTFQWDKMLDVYKRNEYSEEEAEAVADLMFGVGAAINTYYDISGSGAYEAIYSPALFKYFDYSSDIKLVERDYYSKEDWENIILDQLNKKQPVVYTGYDRSIYYGHVFVCDGYDGEGYFHINWGWSGDSNGYYLLDALYPGQGGIGSGKEDYNYYQHALIDILPSYASSEFNPIILGNGNFKAEGIAKKSDKISIKLGDNVRFFTAGNYEEGVRNNGAIPLEGFLGIRLINISTGEETELYCSSSVLLNVTYDDYMSPVRKNASITIPETLDDGTYDIYPVFKINDSNEAVDILYPLSANKVLNMTVEDNVGVIGYGSSADNAGVSVLGDNSDTSFDIYDMRGIRILSNVDSKTTLELLPSGYYIIRNHKSVYKIKI